MLAFQSLKGFSVGCDSRNGKRKGSKMGFNPCKGLVLVAMVELGQKSTTSKGFNPCKGLGWVAIHCNKASCLMFYVSIPVRVWGGLRYSDSI